MKIIKSTIKELEITDAILLSVKEAEEYLTVEERKYNFWWWLRSHGFNSDLATNVDISGCISNYGNLVSYSNVYVRPALQIKNLVSSNLKIGDVFRISAYEFKIISDNLAWMYKQDIGCYAFNEDFKKGNNYETSDVKKIVDEWFELLMFNYLEESK